MRASRSPISSNRRASSEKSTGRSISELGSSSPRASTIARIVELAARTDGPIVEWGPGDGALTLPLAGLGRPLEAVEIDSRAASHLARRVGPQVTVHHGDLLRHNPARGSTLVVNLPYHLTTPALRHLLTRRGWETAVLITYQHVIRRIFTGRGRGLERILRRSAGLSAGQARAFCDRFGYRSLELPRTVAPAHWAEAFRLARR